MPLTLDPSRRERLITDLQGVFLDEFDEALSPFRAERLLDFFLTAVGPQVYNQAVQDARGFMAEKLEDLEGEVYEPEIRPGGGA